MKHKIFLTLAFCLIVFQKTLASEIDLCEMSPALLQSQNDPEFKEIEITKDIISNKELISMFPLGSMQRFFKFPNGFGFYIRSYKPYGQTSYNRPVWGIYKTNEIGRRLIISFGRLEFDGTVNTNELKSKWIDFYENAKEYRLCNKNVSGYYAVTGLLIFSDNFVSELRNFNSLISEYSPIYSNGELYEYGLNPEKEYPRKMVSSRILDAFVKNGERQVKESVTQPDGSVKVTTNIEFLYAPIKVVEAQFEGLSEPSILDMRGFQLKSALRDVKFEIP